MMVLVHQHPNNYTTLTTHMDNMYMCMHMDMCMYMC